MASSKTKARMNAYDEDKSMSLTIHRIVCYVVLTIFALLSLFFFYLMIINATRNTVEIQREFSLLPGKSVVTNFMNAVTDNDNLIKFDEENKPGISNLINIYSSLTEMAINDIEEKFANSNYGEFKREVADVVCEFLTSIQNKYNNILESGELDKILSDGANKVREISKKKFEDMKIKIGLYR